MKGCFVEVEAVTKGDGKKSMKACADYLLKSDFVKATYEE